MLCGVCLKRFEGDECPYCDAVRLKADLNEWKHRAIGGTCRILSGPCDCSLCERDKEIARLKAGEFTPEELQNLCHKQSNQRAAFYEGCHAEQKKIFGQSEREMLVKAIKFHTDKWVLYETEYILPCFPLAAKAGIDLTELVKEAKGNCVITLINELLKRIKDNG